MECGKLQQPETLEEAEGVIREVCAGLIALCVAVQEERSERARDDVAAARTSAAAVMTS